METSKVLSVLGIVVLYGATLLLEIVGFILVGTVSLLLTLALEMANLTGQISNTITRTLLHRLMTRPTVPSNKALGDGVGKMASHQE